MTLKHSKYQQYVPFILRYYKKTKIAINSKAYFFLLPSNQKNIKITTEKILEERKSLHVI